MGRGQLPAPDMRFCKGINEIIEIKPFEFTLNIIFTAGFCEEGFTQVSTLSGQNDFDFEVIEGPNIVSSYTQWNIEHSINPYTNAYFRKTLTVFWLTAAICCLLKVLL